MRRALAWSLLGTKGVLGLGVAGMGSIVLGSGVAGVLGDERLVDQQSSKLACLVLGVPHLLAGVCGCSKDPDLARPGVLGAQFLTGVLGCISAGLNPTKNLSQPGYGMRVCVCVRARAPPGDPFLVCWGSLAGSWAREFAKPSGASFFCCLGPLGLVAVISWQARTLAAELESFSLKRRLLRCSTLCSRKRRLLRSSKARGARAG